MSRASIGGFGSVQAGVPIQVRATLPGSTQLPRGGGGTLWTRPAERAADVPLSGARGGAQRWGRSRCSRGTANLLGFDHRLFVYDPRLDAPDVPGATGRTLMAPWAPIARGFGASTQPPPERNPRV